MTGARHQYFGAHNVFADQFKFMEAAGQTCLSFNPNQIWLYTKLIEEEKQELMDEIAGLGLMATQYFTGKGMSEGRQSAIREDMRVVIGKTAKEACDVIVVAVGLLMSLGINPELAWREVMGSNLSKINPETGRVERREDGKVLKGPTYQPVDETRLTTFIPGLDI